MDTGLTTIPEASIDKHRAGAELHHAHRRAGRPASREAGTALAGTNRPLRLHRVDWLGAPITLRGGTGKETVGAIHPTINYPFPAHPALPRPAREIS